MRTRKSISVRGITTLAPCALASAAPGSAKNNKRIIALGGAFRIFRMAGLSRGFVLGLLLMLWASLGMPPAALGQNGRIDWGQIFSDALINNLVGDSAKRWFAVYLPPSYDSTQKRYPVVYALHGYGGSPCGMVLELQSTLDSMTANRMIGEMIVVFPDGNNRLFGSQYLSSPVIGDYETYIAKDLVAYIDAHYRTLATRNSRGITGASMGGWGSMHLALKFPDVFSVVVPNAGYYDAVGDVAVWIWQNFAPYHPTNLVEFDRLDFPLNWAQSLLAGMLPDLQRPPMYTEYPYELIDGQVVAVEAALQRLREGDVFHGDLGRYTKLPVQLNAIKIVHGTNDTTAPISMAREFTNALAAAGVQFAYEEHEGGHMYVPELSLPFLSDNLEGAELYVATPPGLVGHWTLDEGSGTTAYDSSGNGNDGTIVGNPTWIPGIGGTALEFHGLGAAGGGGDYIDCGNDASLDITGPISIDLWIRPGADDPEGKGTETAPMAKADQSMSPPWSWQVRYGWGSPQPYMAFTFNSSPRAWAYVGRNLERDEWCHIACSYDGTTLKCYLNGEQTDSTPMGQITSSSTSVLIGSDGWGCDWIGAIDDVSIYNRALSDLEILYLASK